LVSSFKSEQFDESKLTQSLQYPVPRPNGCTLARIRGSSSPDGSRHGAVLQQKKEIAQFDKWLAKQK
jgi:hypothetical protein